MKRLLKLTLSFNPILTIFINNRTMSKNIAQKRKQFFPINDSFREYLSGHGRYMELPVIYEDLLGYEDSFPLINEFGEDTLWQTLLLNNKEAKNCMKD